MTAHLRPLDLAIVAAYLIGITLFGLRFREKRGKKSTGVPADRSLRSYFLADNTIPWWAIALSIVSAETSTLTIISIPGVAFAGDFGFLQIVLGYMLGRIVVAVLFLPKYFSGNMLTAYQLIDRRFGPTLHKVTAGLFLLTRAAAEGVRVFAVSIVVGIAIGTRDVLSIAIISALTLLYTFEGGMAAVIWTDVVQMAIYIGGTFVAILTLGRHIGADRSAIAGWSTIHQVAGAAGKFHLFNFALNLTTTYTFWAGILGGTFLTMASHGTDQLMVQRMLAARSLRESRLALLSSGVVIFIQFAFFLLIGAGLWVFYGQHPSASFRTNDYIFPTFIVREMPLGIAGLLVAAILAAAMSNLSAALNSLSSTTVVDFYLRLRPSAALPENARERALISKSSTVLWALVLFAIAVYSLSVGGKGHVVEIGLSIASVAYGCLLGVFLLGTLTKFATQTGATIGMICGFALNLWLWQGTFPKSFGPLTIPHIAFTWYVLIGALVTFAIGALFSLIFRKQSKHVLATAAAAALLLFAVILNEVKDPRIVAAAQTSPATTPDFTPITTLLNTAIAAHKLPGAVVLIGHNGKVVFTHAYGNRKLANEPGLDNKPSPAEPMTEDTIFDMASLTKCLATATAIMQLYEQGKITSFDDPVEKYLPAFNPQHDETRARVTLRMLLTHTSGEAPDVDLRDPWGLAAPDKAEGLHRALTTPLKAAPSSHFEYSDINFILLGDLVETLSDQTEENYVREHIYDPLMMTHTRYLRGDRVCGDLRHVVYTKAPDGVMIGHGEGVVTECGSDQWDYGWVKRTAPTAHDNEGTPATNPDFDHLLRGTVHDPTTRRMGGVAGHAGVFSTAHDISLFASTLLDKLLHNTGPFPLKQSTLRLMTTPEQPGRLPTDISRANAASDKAKESRNPQTSTFDPLLAPAYPAIPGRNLRGFGWDIDSAYSKPRGALFPIGSFGHTGFTGTSLWMDPATNTYVILLANAIHPRGNPPISNLRGELATTTAQILGIGGDIPPDAASLPSTPPPTPGVPLMAPPLGGMSGVAHPTAIHVSYDPSNPCAPPIICDTFGAPSPGAPSSTAAFAEESKTLTGIDVLEQNDFSLLQKLMIRSDTPANYGLLTNQTGLDRLGVRTLDLLTNSPFLREAGFHLTTFFSPEHGIFGAQDTERPHTETDPTTHLPVTSLYGPKDSDRRPTHDQLKSLDAVVIDLQDAGVHFWTYESVLGYFLEAAAAERTTYHHTLNIIVLDRPNPIGGLAVQGPFVDPDKTSYVAYMPLPVRHGLTFGELARYIDATKHLHANPLIVPMQHWTRTEYFADTSLPWTNPSPNLRSPEAAILYPALGLIETTNISVGRGTGHPFSFFGAGLSPTPGAPLVTASSSRVGSQDAWFNAATVAATLTARHIPGVTFTPTTEPIAEDTNHYPFHGQTIPAVHVTVTDRNALDTPELGIEILSVLHRLYPTQFQLAKVQRLLCNQSTLDALQRGDDPRTIAATWQPALTAFRTATTPYLLYP
jgi:SSS family transporter